MKNLELNAFELRVLRDLVLIAYKEDVEFLSNEKVHCSIDFKHYVELREQFGAILLDKIEKAIEE